MYKIITPEQIMPQEAQLADDISNWESFDLLNPFVRQGLVIRAVESDNLDLVNAMLKWRKPGFLSWLERLFDLPTPFSKSFVNVNSLKSIINGVKSPEMLNCIKSIQFTKSAFIQWIFDIFTPSVRTDLLLHYRKEEILKPLFRRLISENNENVLSWLIDQGYSWSYLSDKSLLRFTLDHQADKSLAVILTKQIYFTPIKAFRESKNNSSYIQEIIDFLKDNLIHSHICIPVLLKNNNCLGQLLDGSNIYLFLTTLELRRKWIQIVDDTFSHLIPNNESFPVLTPEEAQQAYYYIAHLLRIDTDATNEKIKLLLSAPSIREIARTEVTKDRPDYLLHLARHFNNRTIEEALLTIESTYEDTDNIQYLDSVRAYFPAQPATSLQLTETSQSLETRIAELHQSIEELRQSDETNIAELRQSIEELRYMCSDEYIHNLIANVFEEHRRSISNTLELDTSTESSMRYLSEEENNQLSRFINYYTPKLEEAGGVVPVLKTLEEELAAAYQQSPAQYEKMSLPLEWESWESSALFKNPEAANAYYQHKIHTAWRYLQIPNPWFSSDAAYFENVNMENGEVKRTGFYKNYRELVALLWLAAQDTQQPLFDTEGNAISHKKQIHHHFWVAMADLNRAHNLDKRPRLDKEGKVMKEKNGHDQTEEFNNNKPDEPSCIPGTLLRLLKSLPFHPMLSHIITKASVKGAIQEFIRDYYRDRIQKLDNPGHINELLDNYFEDLNPEPLKTYNIPENAITTFIEKLVAIWGDQRRNIIEKTAKRYFEENKTHLADFYGELTSILPQKESSKPAASDSVANARGTFFESSSSTTTVEDNNSDKSCKL